LCYLCVQFLFFSPNVIHAVSSVSLCKFKMSPECLCLCVPGEPRPNGGGGGCVHALQQHIRKVPNTPQSTHTTLHYTRVISFEISTSRGSIRTAAPVTHTRASRSESRCDYYCKNTPAYYSGSLRRSTLNTSSFFNATRCFDRWEGARRI